MHYLTELATNANDVNTTFLTGKTRFKKIATDCVCSELLKHVLKNIKIYVEIFALIYVFSFLYDCFTGQRSSHMDTLKMKIAFFT